jgi:hypothetical protein
VSEFGTARIRNPIEGIHYKMNDSDTNATVVDVGLGGNDGTASSNTDTMSTTGKINQSLEFDGTEFIDIDTAQAWVGLGTESTISMWVHPTDFAADRAVFSFGGTLTADYFRIRVNTDGTVRAAFIDSGTNQWTVDSVDTLSAATWHHIAFTHDGIEPNMWIDGVKQTLSYATDVDRTQWLVNNAALNNGRIGCLNQNSGGNSQFWLGRIDDVRFYAGMAFSTFQVNHIYKEGDGSEDSIGLLFFDGNSDYLTVPDASGTDYDVVGSALDDWTIDLWVKHTDHAAAEYYVHQFEDSSNLWLLNHTDGVGLKFQADSGGVNIIEVTGAEITDTAWHHVTMVKSGSKYGLYLDGVQGGFVDDSSTDTFAAGLEIGRFGTSAHYFDGWMEQVQITDANKFGVVPSEATLLIDFDGADTATTHTATTGQTVTFVGNAQLDNTASVQKFGSACLLLDGTGDYTHVPDNPDWDLGTNDWTMDMWVRWNNIGTTQMLLSQSTEGGNGNRFQWLISSGGTFNALWQSGNIIRFNTSSTTSWTARAINTWYHLTLSRYGGAIHVFIDGVEHLMTAVTPVLNNSLGGLANPFYIGVNRPAVGGGSNFFNGWIDDVRITNSVALWRGNFTPPDVAVDIFGIYASGDTNIDITIPTAPLERNQITEPTQEYFQAAIPSVGVSQIIIAA